MEYIKSKKTILRITSSFRLTLNSDVVTLNGGIRVVALSNSTVC